MQKQGKYILIDGPDGCGKTTLIQTLKQQHPEFIYVKEPGDECFESNRQIRQILLHGSQELPPEVELHLFLADRLVVLEYVQEQLALGRTVISDRSLCSTLAYQTTPIHSILKFHDSYLKKALKHIDNIVLLSIDFETHQQRLTNRGLARDRIEQKSNQFFEQVIARYQHLKPLLEMHDYTDLASKIDYLDATQSVHRVYQDFVAKFL